MSTDYLIAVPAEEFGDNKTYVKGEDIPLHVKLLPWFSLPETLSEDCLHRGIVWASERVEGPFQIEAGSRGMLGEDPVEYHEILTSSGLSLLHEALREELVEGRKIQIGNKPFHPCVVSRRDGTAFQTGKRFLVKEITLFQKSSRGIKTLIARYPL